MLNHTLQADILPGGVDLEPRKKGGNTAHNAEHTCKLNPGSVLTTFLYAESWSPAILPTSLGTLVRASEIAGILPTCTVLSRMVTTGHMRLVKLNYK